MVWTKLSSGKHVGRTLPQVLLRDPDWFFWAVETRIFDKHPRLAKEAELLNVRARTIKIPKTKYPDSVVEYYIHPPTRKFSHFEIVQRNQELHHGSTPAFRSNTINMSVPHRIAAYDKLGSKNLLSSLKFYLFGSQSARLTRKLAETFFAEDSNFERLSRRRGRITDSSRRR